MANTFLHKTPCSFDPDRAIIFKLNRVKAKKKNWYVRILRNREGSGPKYFQRSLGYDGADEQHAMELAKGHWIQLLQAESVGNTYGHTKFGRLWEAFITETPLTHHRRDRLEHVYRRYFSEYFGNLDVPTINTKTYVEYLKWRMGYWQRREDAGLEMPRTWKYTPSNTTLRSERQALHQFLQWCRAQDYISNIPYLPWDFQKLDIHPNMKKHYGKALSDSHYTMIVKRLKKRAFQAEHHTEIIRYARLRLYFFVVICGNTLLRPGTEAMNLKWKHIEIKKSPKHNRYVYPYLHITHGKMGERNVIGTYRSAVYLMEWRKVAKQFGYGKDDDYVFANYDGKICYAHYLGRCLKRELKGKTKKEKDVRNHPDGTKVTLYSLCRHTAIVRRIRHSKWDVSQVAHAAGTSILQISTAYANEWAEQNPDRFADTAPEDGPKWDEKEIETAEDLFSKWS